MNRVKAGLLSILAASLVTLAGCTLLKSKTPEKADASVPKDPDHRFYQTTASRVEFTDIADFEGRDDFHLTATAPVTVDDEDINYWDMTLQEAVRLALNNSKVLRDLSGRVLRDTQATPVVQDPAIQETDPRFGIDAALSAFDASFASSAFLEGNDRALNNQFFGGGTRRLKQDLATFQSQISKQGALGTEFIARNSTDYDANNAPGNTFGTARAVGGDTPGGGAWNTIFELEMRHPWLQGAGQNFNRIAGPSDTPGITNGVLLARIDNDISLAEFETGVRDFISNVENTYWDLYFAYRDLDAKMKARDTALKTWNRVYSLNRTGRRGGEAEKEAQAREQYHRFQAEVQNAWAGRRVFGTRTRNGSPGGTFYQASGVLVTERRLRLLLGLPISEDKTILRPADAPPKAKASFDWEESVQEATLRRVELRQQRWAVKRVEKELEATRNFLLPRLDTVARYRWRGFGRDLFRQHPNTPASMNDPTLLRKLEINNAFDSLINGDFQEWQLGMELSFPIGYRRAHTALRNAELRLARERTILKEQEREVVHDLSNSIAELKRTFAVMQTNFYRVQAAQARATAVTTAYENDQAQLDLVLDAQNRLSQAETEYFQSQIEYALAIKNVHLDKGSLLDYNEIYLAEGDWPHKAYKDAKERAALRSRPLDGLQPLHHPETPVSQGAHPQLLLESHGHDGESHQQMIEQPADWPLNETPPAPAPPANDANDAAEKPTAEARENESSASVSSTEPSRPHFWSRWFRRKKSAAEPPRTGQDSSIQPVAFEENAATPTDKQREELPFEWADPSTVSETAK